MVLSGAMARIGRCFAASLVVVAAATGCSGATKGTSTPSTSGGGAASTVTTSTTVPVVLSATTVAQSMIRLGLPATISMIYTAANDPNNLLGRQGGYTSKVSIQDKRQPAGNLANSSTAGGASIECYPDTSGAASRYSYLRGFSGSIVGDGYDYLSGPCVLRVDKALTPDQAAQYESLFDKSTG